MRRLWPALALAGLASLALAGPAAAHAQLISSSPGAGEVVADPPAELRLVFSERVDPAFAGIDLLDQDGALVVGGLGEPDPADPHLFVAELPPLADGLYTANWEVLSAADGHVTSGFITFGVGDVELSGVARDAGAGGLHVGHTPLIAVLDAASRAAGYAGSMLAFGLALISLAVLRPVLGAWPRRGALSAGAALAVAGVGAIGGIVVGASGLTGADSLGIIDYALGTRTGVLLLGQAVIGGGGAIAASVVARRASSPAFALAGMVGAACLILIGLRSHAAASDAIGPLVADVAHLAAAGTWLAGLLALVVLGAGAFGSLADGAMRQAVPRFSALAVVSIGLVAVTGLYAAWLQVGDLAALGTDYGLVLLAKLAVVGAALTLGGINYLDAGRNLSIAGGLRRRVGAELALAGVVIVLTANLTTGSPPAQLATVQVPPNDGQAAFALALQPGAPGPNRALVSPPPPGVHVGTVELQLERLDQTGTTTVELRQDPEAAHGTRFVVDGVLLPPDSRWSAVAVMRDGDGTETERGRFTFAVDAERLVVDRGFSLQLGHLLAGALLFGGLLSLGYWLGGGTLPRTDPRVGRRALLAGGVAGGLLGAVLLAWGPRV